MKANVRALMTLLAIVACSAKKIDLNKALQEQAEEDAKEEAAWRSKKAPPKTDAGLPVDMTFGEDGSLKVADGVDLKEHLTKLAQVESQKFGSGTSGGLKLLEVQLVPAMCTQAKCCKEYADRFSRLLHSGGVSDLQHDIAAPYCKITYFFVGDKIKLKPQVRTFLQDQKEVYSIYDEGKEYYAHHIPEPSGERKSARKKPKRTPEEHKADLIKEKARVDGLIKKARKINRLKELKEQREANEAPISAGKATPEPSGSPKEDTSLKSNKGSTKGEL